VLDWGWHVEHWGWLGIVLSFVASLLLFDTWFYWFHRLLHTERFYRAVHQWHHVTETPTAWSNNSDLAVDNLFLQSYWLVAHLLIPIALPVLLAHKLFDQVTGVIGHSGHEHAGPIAWLPSPLVGVTHHDQHHRYFRCNYATHFSLWDRIMGTLHPSHDAELKANLAAGRAAKR
jgi:Delta7-sterol 5-desaturase